MISSARKTNTLNQFILYYFLDQLENIFQEYPEQDVNKIDYCNESEFPTNQTRGHVVSVWCNQCWSYRLVQDVKTLMYLGYVELVVLGVMHL